VGSPYVAALARQPFWVNAYGPARRGKTTAILLAGSVWGRVKPPLPDPDSVLISWDATGKGPGRYLGQLGILPAFFDETGTAEFTPPEWARMNYGITQGSSRLQAMQRGIGSRRTPGHRGVTFVTGNDLLCDGMAAGPFQGLPARLLQFESPFTTSAAEAENLDTLLVRGYGHTGPAVLAAVTPEQMSEIICQAETDLQIPAEGLPRTVGLALALGVAGAMAADRVTGGQPTAPAALQAAREYLAAHSAEPETDGQRMLTALADSLTYSPSAWASEEAARDLLRPGDGGGGAIPRHGQDHKLRGFYDGERLYVAPWAWQEHSAESGAGSSAAARELHAAGVLHVPAQRRKRGEWKGNAPRWAGRGEAYVIQRTAVEDAGRDGEDQAPLCQDCGGPLDEERVRIGAAVHFECPPQAPAGPLPECAARCGVPLEAWHVAEGLTAHPSCPDPEPATQAGPPAPPPAGPPAPVVPAPRAAPALLPGGDVAAARRAALADVTGR